MISVEMQTIDHLYASGYALRAGTLFPELNKPLSGYCPPKETCGTDAQAAAFAVWELRLFLDTHPHDKEALALFHKLCQEAPEENYATAFLAENSCAWHWGQDPWPWEYDCHCGAHD